MEFLINELLINWLNNEIFYLYFFCYYYFLVLVWNKRRLTLMRMSLLE